MHGQRLSQPSLRTFTPRALFPRRSSVSFSCPAYRIGSSMGRSPLVELTPTGTPAKSHTRKLLWLRDQSGLTAMVSVLSPPLEGHPNTSVSTRALHTAQRRS